MLLNKEADITFLHSNTSISCYHQRRNTKCKRDTI